MIFAWLWMLQGHFAVASYYGPFLWHGHEMIFGYTIAVMAGFLLTAVRNWTGQETTTQGGLAALSLLWLAGRIAPLIVGAEPTSNAGFERLFVALVDLSFIPALAITLSLPLIKSRNYRNLFFLPLFLVLGGCNLVIHLQVNGLVIDLAYAAERLAIGLVLVAIAVVGGRVIPAFSRSALQQYQCRLPAWLDKLSLVTVIALVLSYSAGQSGSGLFILLAVTAGLTNLARLAYWHDPRVWRNPMLWVLYTAYLWMILGCLLFAVENDLNGAAKSAMHAMTTGAIGVMTLGMMVRVTLGHMGRKIQASRWVVCAFVSINLSAITRVFLPMVSLDYYSASMLLSGSLWLLAFGLFLAECGVVLIRPRVDGQPG